MRNKYIIPPVWSNVICVRWCMAPPAGKPPPSSSSSTQYHHHFRPEGSVLIIRIIHHNCHFQVLVRRRDFIDTGFIRN
eukprot:859912-Karenia_brevis.AAC.1